MISGPVWRCLVLVEGLFVLAEGTLSRLKVSYCTDAPPSSMKWVESPEHGGGGPDWVEVSVAAIVLNAVTGSVFTGVADMAIEPHRLVHLDCGDAFGCGECDSLYSLGICATLCTTC